MPQSSISRKKSRQCSVSDEYQCSLWVISGHQSSHQGCPLWVISAIASQERLTIGYLPRLLRLPSLAPDIVAAIINGKHPPQLSAKRLMRLTPKLPTDWAEQRKLLGFQDA